MNKVQLYVKDGDKTRIASYIDEIYTSEGNKLDFNFFNAQYKTSNWINIEQDPWNVSPSDQDSTAKIQSIIDSLPDTDHYYLFIPRVYNVTTLTVPGYIDVIGLSPTFSGFNRIEGKPGPVLKILPFRGVQGAPRKKQQIKNLNIEGNNIGALRITGIVDQDSNLVTLDTTVGVLPGYLIEGYGIPTLTRVVSLDGNIATLSNPCTLDNYGVSSKNKIVIRKAITVTATSSVNSNSITVTNASELEIGMRAFGENLEDDEDTEYGLSTWTIITNINGNTVTLDRKVKASGTFNFTGFIANDGILIVEAKQAINYQQGKEYESIDFENIIINKMGYHGIVVRSGRDQCKFFKCRVTSCGGYGYFQSSASDCKLIGFGSGVNWYSCIYIGYSATPRVIDCEIWQTALVDKYPDIYAKNVPEFMMSDTDLNGRLKISGKTDELSDIMNIHNVNFKFQPANLFHDGTSDCYITAVNCVVNVNQGAFKPHRQQGSRPNYIAKGRVIINGQNLLNDKTNPECPYALDIEYPDTETIVRCNAVNLDTLKTIDNRYKLQVIFEAGNVNISRFFDKYILRKTNSAIVAAYTVRLPLSTDVYDGYKSPEIVFASGATTLNVTPALNDTCTVINPPTTAPNGFKFQFMYLKTDNIWVPC
jgi:hypothetical protein